MTVEYCEPDLAYITCGPDLSKTVAMRQRCRQVAKGSLSPGRPLSQKIEVPRYSNLSSEIASLNIDWIARKRSVILIRKLIRGDNGKTMVFLPNLLCSFKCQTPSRANTTKNCTEQSNTKRERGRKGIRKVGVGGMML